ncbi:LysR family transcriptional regulator [Abyssibius alkaniclasticus]|uniref:LysR family transcriptional regulator n=1 Tax=Abyssibius alkaniclasticus TaxID=2881234 RepID=UPI0040580C4B
MPVAPPRPKDLPLNALRAFEAAARLQSFVLAAGELGVTPGAITAHIKGLEAALAAPLFIRHARGVAPTPLARQVLPGFVAGFDALGQAAQSLRDAAAPQHVHIATLPALAQLWLSPRLPGLRAVAPEIEISITAMEAPPNLKRAPYHLCLFYQNNPARDALEPDEIFPVCAPSVAAQLTSPAALADTLRISDAVWQDDWALWAMQAAPGLELAANGPAYSLYALAVEEAVNGAGVLMGHAALVERHLQSGALVAPFAARVTLPRSLCLWAARPAQGGAVARVADWLRAATQANAASSAI